MHGSVEYLISGVLAGTYTPGSTGADGGTGVGAIITLSATGTLTVDSGPDPLQVNDRVLIAGGVTAYAGASSIVNGIYVVTNNGAGAQNIVFTLSLIHI